MQYAGDLNLTVSKTFTDAGTLLATGALGVNGGTTANLQLQKTGVLQAGGLLTLTANSLSPQTGFQMIGGSGDLTIARTFDKRRRPVLHRRPGADRRGRRDQQRDALHRRRPDPAGGRTRQPAPAGSWTGAVWGAWRPTAAAC